MLKINRLCGIGVVPVFGFREIVDRCKADVRISAVRCLICGGDEESDGLDSFFCDIAAIDGDTDRPNKAPKRPLRQSDKPLGK